MQRKSIVLATCMLSLTACGDYSSSGSSSVAQTQQQQTEGTYRAVLTAVQTKVAQNARGSAQITVQGDDVMVQVQMQGVPSNMTHMQHIHTGSACASATGDRNGDGFIDPSEAKPSSGSVLIPLDSNLNSQDGGVYPTAGAAGTYAYNETASLTRMLADLRAPDTNPNDSIVKLPLGDELNLEGKVIEVHGVPAGTNLPGTVGTEDGKPAAETLPIACGVITRLSNSGTGTTTGGTTGGTGAGTTTTGTGGTSGTSGTTTGGSATTGSSGTGTSTTSGINNYGDDRPSF